MGISMVGDEKPNGPENDIFYPALKKWWKFRDHYRFFHQPFRTYTAEEMERVVLHRDRLVMIPSPQVVDWDFPSQCSWDGE